MEYKFNANHNVIKEIQGCYTIEELEKEQGMYSATPDFCMEHGGPVTKSILNEVPKEYIDDAYNRGLYPNIDVRVHRLYPGNYPAYPGWHCDAQFRETYFGQPRTEQTELSDHLICTVSTNENGVSNTEFIDEPIKLDIDDYSPEEGTPFWAFVDDAMISYEGDSMPKWVMKDGVITTFDCWTLHRAMPTRVRGWRLFFRMAMWYRPNLGNGKLSRQEVIYMDMNQPTGW